MTANPIVVDFRDKFGDRLVVRQVDTRGLTFSTYGLGERGYHDTDPGSKLGTVFVPAEHLAPILAAIAGVWSLDNDAAYSPAARADELDADTEEQQ